MSGRPMFEVIEPDERAEKYWENIDAARWTPDHGWITAHLGPVPVVGFDSNPRHPALTGLLR